MSRAHHKTTNPNARCVSARTWRAISSRGVAETDVLMAAAIGDLEPVRKHLNARPESIRMSVSEQYFPEQSSRTGRSTSIWTRRTNKTAHPVAR